MTYILTSLMLLALSCAQNIAFSIAGRSRNRSNIKYHLIASFLSNGIWFLTFRELVIRDMDLTFFPWYCAGTMTGSVIGMRISMWVERLLGAESDAHLQKKLEARIQALENKNGNLGS